MADQAGSPPAGDAAAAVKRLEKLFGAILAHARQSPELGRAIEAALAPSATGPARSTSAPANPPRRVAQEAAPARSAAQARPAPPRHAAQPEPPPAPALLDPFAVYDTGWETMLRERLGRLDVEQLLDVIHHFDLDPKGKLAERGSAEKLRDWIVEAVVDHQETG